MTKYEELKKHLKNNQNTWLVTGAAGFIGSNLVEKLLILNQKVIGLDNFETGHQHNLDQAIEDAQAALATENCTLNTDNFHFIKGDIRNPDDCKKTMQWQPENCNLKAANSKVDYVLHQAALGSVPRSIEDPVRTNQANIDGFLNMLVAAKDAKVKRFVYAASSSTYGDHPDLPKVENKIGKPLSPYAVTKVVNELYASVFAKTYGFKTIGLRYFNIFGKRQDPEGAYAAVIPKWTEALIKGKEVFINGDGKTSRDFCYIKNAVQINILAAMTDNDAATDQVYNVAVGDRTTLNNLYKIIKTKLTANCQLPTENLNTATLSYRDFRAGDVRHSQADISKAQSLLGYSPSHKISEGMDEAMVWYVEALKNQ